MWSKQRYRLTLLKALSPYARGVRRFMLLNLLISLFLMVLGFIEPLFYKIFINDVILGRQTILMLFVAGGYLSVFALNLLCAFARNYCVNRIVNRVTFRVRMKMLKGFFSQDFRSYDTQSVGDMKMRLDDDTSCISVFAAAQTVDYLIALITIPVALGLMFAIEWRFALFSCFSVPFTLLLDHVVARHEAVILNEQRENDQRMSTWLHMSIQGWREIKALNLQKHEERQFASYIHKYAVFFGTWINYWVLRVLVIPKLKNEFFMQFSLYFFGGLLIIAGHLEIGALLVFAQYYNILSDALTNVSSADADLLSLRIKSDRMLTELGKKTGSRSKAPLPEEITSIEFADVSFSYPGSEKHVIRKLSFTIHKGERIAITGPSGAGKTTVLKLMTGCALDQHSESVIHDALSGISKDKTIIIVSHRQSSLAFYNRVIEIRNN